MSSRSLEGLDPAFAHAMQQLEAKQEADAQRQIEEQRERGRCNITPLPVVATKPFRAELYTEALPIFVANSFRGRSRTWQRELEHPETGEPVLDILVVGRTSSSDEERGVLTQVHQACWYKLLHLWNRAHYPIVTNGTDSWGQLKMTGYELVTAIRGDDAAHHYRRARSLLADLAGIPIRREQVYTWRNEVDDAQFTLLAGVEWNGKALNRFTGRPSARGSSEVVILFSKFVTERFLRRRIKTLMLEPYLQLAGTQRGRSAEIAPLLYPKLDRELARKDEYHRTLVSLLDELGIRPCRYKSKRRLRVAPAVEALDGLPIQRGQFTLHVELRLSADEQDYVLVARKSRQTQLALS